MSSVLLGITLTVLALMLRRHGHAWAHVVVSMAALVGGSALMVLLIVALLSR